MGYYLYREADNIYVFVFVSLIHQSPPHLTPPLFGRENSDSLRAQATSSPESE